jgi:hypothetical protein
LEEIVRASVIVEDIHKMSVGKWHSACERSIQIACVNGAGESAVVVIYDDELKETEFGELT